MRIDLVVLSMRIRGSGLSDDEDANYSETGSRRVKKEADSVATISNKCAV